jgi:large subunit ribosomal protein L17
MMLRNMVTSLLEHEKIETTLAKAKEVRRLADKVILLGKRGDLHARRQALSILTDKGVVKKVFSEISPRFQERTSGFTHIFRLGNRVGDGAPMSMVMLTEEKVTATKEKKTGKVRSKARKTTRTKTEKEGQKKKPPKKQRKAMKEAEPPEESSEENTPSRRRRTGKTKTRGKRKEEASDSSP